MKIIRITIYSIAVLTLLVIGLFGYRDIPLAELKEKYAQAPSAFLPIGGMDVHYRDEGNTNDSLPIVLIHGTGASLHTFDAWTSRLQYDRRIVRMDLPGYGLTGPFPDRDYSIANYVEFLHDFLSARSITNCVLGGNSLGGKIAWRFALAYPSMVGKLVLIDAAGYPSQSKSSPIAFRMAKIPIVNKLFTFITPRSVAESSLRNVFVDQSKVTDELVDRYFDLILRAGNRQAFVDRFSAKRDTTAYHNISQISQPTLVLWGDQDLLIPTENAHRFHDDLPNSTLAILKDAGHVPMEESPDQSLEILLSFLNSDLTLSPN